MQIIAPALRSAVSHFGWTRIALLTQDEVLFTGVCHSATVLYSVYYPFFMQNLKNFACMLIAGVCLIR